MKIHLAIPHFALNFALNLSACLLMLFQSNVHAEITLSDHKLHSHGIQLLAFKEVFDERINNHTQQNLNVNLDTALQQQEYYFFIPADFESPPLSSIYNRALTTKLNAIVGLDSFLMANLQSSQFDDLKTDPEDEAHWSRTSSFAIMLDEDL